MGGVGLEVLFEGLIPEIAYSGEKGVSISELLKIVRQYHSSLGGRDATAQDGATQRLQPPLEGTSFENSLTEAEMSSARWAWDWLRSRPQIVINGNKRWNRVELSEVLALPEPGPGDAANPSAPGDVGRVQRQTKEQKPKKKLTTRPRIHPSEDLVWQILTRHGVDYKRVPALEWACLQGIASARAEGILQSDLRRLVNQDKRSLPKRTDSLARKGYIAKRTVVVQKMKTSRLWLTDFAPPLVEAEISALDLMPETLSKDLEPVPWHHRWTGTSIDMDALGRTVIGVVKAFNVIRYADLRFKMGVVGKHWQMKTLARNCQRLVDTGVFKYTAAALPGSRKVFKDCLKFLRGPSAEEWDKFLATGKKTSQYSDPTRHREPKPNALALYGNGAEGDGQAPGYDRAKLKRIFSGWAPEKPLSQTVFEVIRSAGPEGASNPQASVATVGYQHRRYLSSYLARIAETQQPPHLEKFQVVSKRVRTGKTCAYMFSAPGVDSAPGEVAHKYEETTQSEQPMPAESSSDLVGTEPYGFGATRPKAFAEGEGTSLSALSKLARKSMPYSRRKNLPRAKPDTGVEIGHAPETATEMDVEPATGEQQPGTMSAAERPPEETAGTGKAVEVGETEPTQSTVALTEKPPAIQEQAPPPTTKPTAANQPETGPAEAASAKSNIEDLILKVRYNGRAGKLQVRRLDQTLTFVKTGRGSKKPLVIHIDDSLDGPSTRDVPGRNDKGLVFVTGAKSGKNPRTYVFVFADDAQNQDKAASIQQEVIKMKSPPNSEHTPVPAEAPAEEEITVEAAPATPAPTRGKKRGRGGGRAKGRRGQAGGKRYICPKCGGSWKNDIGLKYHLEKAQVPCNPNFDPMTLIEQSRKRRRVSPVPPAGSAQSEAGNEEGPRRSRRAKVLAKARKRIARPQFKVRAALRTTLDSDHKFRGLDFSDIGPVTEPLTRPSERPRLVSQGTFSRPTTSVNGRGGTHPSTTVGTMSYSEPVIAAAVTDEAPTDKIPSQARPKWLPPSPPTARMARSVLRILNDAPVGGDAFDKNLSSHNVLGGSSPQHTSRITLLNGHQGASPLRNSVVASQSGLAQAAYPEHPLSSLKESRAGQQAESRARSLHDEATGIKPFTPSSDYDRMATDTKRRTAQAFDIINYLLDNSCGAFPGDKALFYALTKVFLKEFPKQMPPTWKSYQSAVKALETRKLATVHTHMLKTERGRLQTCTLLVRTGVDLNGPTPTFMKREMREAYPGIYIPAPFSPNKEELALLEELDKKPSRHGQASKPNPNGEKFRSRRKIEEVEVFSAPYYLQSAAGAEVKSSHLWISRREQVSEGGGFAGSRKRSATDELSPGPVEKRTRTGHQWSPTRPRFSPLDDRDVPVDPGILGGSLDPTSTSYDRTRQVDASQPADAPEGQEEPASVLAAIKAYGLLPARWGRGRHTLPSTKALTKLSPELGRIMNPGLASLPRFFFGGAASAATTQPIPAEFQFLEPNMDLDDAESQEDDQDQGGAPSPASSADASLDAGVEDYQTSDGTAVEHPRKFKFILPSVLGGSSGGSWPTLSTHFFEHYDTSFTLKGRMPSRSWLVTQNLPFGAEQMTEKQDVKGLSWRDWVDRRYAKFCSHVNRCAAWEQSQAGSAMMSGSVGAPGSIFINVSPPASRLSSKGGIVLTWSDETQYGVETLPYEDLEGDDYADVTFVEDGLGRPTARRSFKKPRIETAPGMQPRKAPGRPPKLKLQATKTMRELTAYPRTAADFLRVPGDQNEELDWSSENVRLAAFIVVTTLLGGVDRVVDWGLMLRLMPDQTISQLRHHWCALRKDRLSTIVTLTDKFRRAFLKAYENNEIPPIDFDNILAYDWKSLIRWTTELDLAERATLPATRTALEENFTLTRIRYGNREWREAYHHPQRSVFNRFQDSTSEPVALAVDKMSDPRPSTDMVVAMSWTRSLCVTPVHAYSAEAVLHRRNTLFPHRTRTEITELMIKGVDQLQRQGVISKSSTKWSNGRRWRFNARVQEALEKAAQQEKFAKAVQFKKELDQAFRAGETKRVTYMTNDGMIMALLNLQANGRVRIETTGQPNVPMGHEPGNYETRKYTKKYLHFRLDVVPTETYLFDDNDGGKGTTTNELTEFRARIKTAAPPTRGPGGAVPVWCDVFGRVDVERWLKHLSAVLITLGSRGSMRADEVAKTLKPAVMLFEAELIMAWAERAGLLRAQLDGTAPALMEWWWIAVDAQREALAAVRPRKMLPSGRPTRAVEGVGGAAGEVVQS